MADEEKANGHDGPAAPEGADSLEVQLAAAREEAKANHDRWLRERADLENLKRRSARERTDTLKYGIEGVIRDLLPMVDSLERALVHGQGDAKHPLVAGVEMTLTGIREVLQRHGVTRVEAKGQPFDPAVHEAVAHVETADHAPNSVVEEYQPGYRLHDRLLRPAMVSVAKAAAGAAGGTNLAGDQSGD